MPEDACSVTASAAEVTVFPPMSSMVATGWVANGAPSVESTMVFTTT